MSARKFAVLIGTQTVADREVAYVSWARANQLFRLAEEAGRNPCVVEVPVKLSDARLRAALESLS